MRDEAQKEKQKTWKSDRNRRCGREGNIGAGKKARGKSIRVKQDQSREKGKYVEDSEMSWNEGEGPGRSRKDQRKAVGRGNKVKGYKSAEEKRGKQKKDK